MLNEGQPLAGRENIFLIGMMGAGKSSTGRALGSILGYEFLDLDMQIEQEQGKTINEIFVQEGEETFRCYETRSLKNALKAGRRVIGTGGGIVTRDENITAMKKNGTVIYLRASTDVLWDRVKDDGHRPLLKGSEPRQDLADLLSRRREKYEAAADIQIETDHRSPENVAAEIAGHFKRRSR